MVYNLIMYHHASDDYVCPICLGVEGMENESTLIRQPDIVYRDDKIMAFVASYFIQTCEGHLIVVPNKHYENMYDLPDEIGAQIFAVARKMALVMKKAYGCEGVTTLQNNEPQRVSMLTIIIYIYFRDMPTISYIRG